MIMRLLSYVISATVIASISQSAVSQTTSQPRITALLVGASDFADARLGPLHGGRNDAVLMALTLVNRGARPQDIKLLISHPEAVAPAYRQQLAQSGVQISGAPTHDQILAVWDQLAKSTQRGDQVVILLDGHGEQQDARKKDGSEFLDLDQVFLPEDSVVARRDEDDFRTPFPNAIIDDEIGEKLDAVRHNGGNVLFIADFCHSTGSTRGAPTEGAPQPFLHLDMTRTRDGGSLVAFFAAPAEAKGKQSSVPYWSYEKIQHGVLSFYMVSALADDRADNYYTLFQLLNADIRQQADLEGVSIALPTPQGDLSQSVLGKAADSNHRFGSIWAVPSPAGDGSGPTRLSELFIPAGSVTHIVQGTIFSIVPKGSKADGALVYGRAEDVGSLRTRIVPVDYQQRSASAWNTITVSVAGNDGNYDRGLRKDKDMLIVSIVAAPPTGRDFLVSLPARQEAKTPEQRKLIADLRALLPDIGATEVRGDANAHLAIRLVDGRLRMLNSNRPDAWSYGDLPLGGRSPGVIKELISQAIQRAEMLMRVRGGLGDLAVNNQNISSKEANNPERARNPVRVDFYLRRASRAESEEGKCDAQGFQERTKIVTGAFPAGVEPFDFTSAPTLHMCDEIYFRVTNESPDKLNILPVVLAPEGRILELPTRNGESILYPPGEKGWNGYQLSTDPSNSSIRDDFFLVVMPFGNADNSSPIHGQLAQAPILCDPNSGCQETRGMDRAAAKDEMVPDARRFLTFLKTGRGSAGTLNVTAQRFGWYTAPARR